MGIDICFNRGFVSFLRGEKRDLRIYDNFNSSDCLLILDFQTANSCFSEKSFKEDRDMKRKRWLVDARVLWILLALTFIVFSMSFVFSELPPIVVEIKNLSQMYNDMNDTFDGRYCELTGCELTGLFNVSAFNTGDILSGELEAEFGDPFGAIEIGNTQLIQTDLIVAGMNLNGSFIIRNTESDSPIEFVFATTDNLVRLAIPKAGPDSGIYNPRSMMVGGDLGQIFNTNITSCLEQGYTQIDCNTSTTGADLGIQDDLEVRGSAFINENATITDTLFSNQILANSGTATLGGTGGTNNENLIIDFESSVNTVVLASTSGANSLRFNFTSVEFRGTSPGFTMKETDESNHEYFFGQSGTIFTLQDLTDSEIFISVNGANMDVGHQGAGNVRLFGQTITLEESGGQTLDIDIDGGDIVFNPSTGQIDVIGNLNATSNVFGSNGKFRTLEVGENATADEIVLEIGKGFLGDGGPQIKMWGNIHGPNFLTLQVNNFGQGEFGGDVGSFVFDTELFVRQDNDYLITGAGQGGKFKFGYSTAGSADHGFIGSRNVVAGESSHIVISDFANSGFDFWHPATNDIIIYLHSLNQAKDEFFGMQHNSSNVLLESGKGGFWINSTSGDFNVDLGSNDFKINNTAGISGNYSTGGGCWMFYTKGIMTSTNCTVT